MTNGIKTKIITSFYEIRSEEEKGDYVYKPFSLLTLTIRDLIFDEYEYIFYTDKYTYLKYEGDINNWTKDKPNVQIKFCELNSPFYLNKINPTRIKRFQDGEIWEREICIKNYVEVMYNKFKFLLNEAQQGYNLLWIDAGLFGTSCNDGWRDYMVEIAHTKNFLDKINDKINQNGFICLRGKDIMVNHDIQSRIDETYGVKFYNVVGGLFGGKSDIVVDLLKDYENMLTTYVSKYQDLLTDQQFLSIVTHKKSETVKFYDFEDWVDLQRGLLNIMDVYDENKYIKNSCELYSTKYLDRYKK
jgi:hypothetical protein